MTLKDMKIKVLSLIEEINPDSEVLTDDPDISAKINEVINQVMYEVARIKKIPDYVEVEALANELIRFEDITSITGHEVYQLNIVKGIEYELKGMGTIIKPLEDGVLEIDYFRYPARISIKEKEENAEVIENSEESEDTEDSEVIEETITEDTYIFELSPDALEILPYGVAADLLKSDVSANYGQVYAQRYESMLQRLDTRYSMGTFVCEGGVL